jgi:hypothetical protein
MVGSLGLISHYSDLSFTHFVCLALRSTFKTSHSFKTINLENTARGASKNPSIQLTFSLTFALLRITHL